MALVIQQPADPESDPFYTRLSGLEDSVLIKAQMGQRPLLSSRVLKCRRHLAEQLDLVIFIVFLVLGFLLVSLVGD